MIARPRRARSALARWQAERVGALLGGDVELVLVTTTGDRDQTSDLHAIGGRGVFTKEVQQAVLDGRADVAVHSAKDWSVDPRRVCVLAAVPERADARDALVGATLDGDPDGRAGRNGLGAPAGPARGRASRPRCSDRCAATSRPGCASAREMGYDAVVVAYAALERLGLAAEATEVLDPAVVLPQAAQGALAVECRADDDGTHRARCARSTTRPRTAPSTPNGRSSPSSAAGATCRAARWRRSTATSIVLDALLASLDGHVVLRRRVEGDDPSRSDRGRRRAPARSPEDACEPGAAGGPDGASRTSLEAGGEPHRDRVPRRRRAG